jgi:hypothetical protein
MMLKLVIFFFFFVACQKEMVVPGTATNTAIPTAIKNLQVNKNTLTLLEGNADATAIQMTWDAVNVPGVVYIAEAGIAGTGFDQKVELGTTDQPAVRFTVKELNNYLRQLIYANNTARVELRVRAQMPAEKAADIFTAPIAVEATTYLPYTEYVAPRMFRVPGNYQNWKLADAPKIVDADNDGVYEGYINFNTAYPQFLLVKGDQWLTYNTYYYIGKDKFGFGGTMMAVFNGAGAYRMTANTNTNTWACTKINNWALTGTAVCGEATMQPDADPLTWVIKTKLNAGVFRFKANDTDAIVMGQDPAAINGVPAYNGADIIIKKAGTYTIKLDLRLAGNYGYCVQMNP